LVAWHGESQAVKIFLQKQMLSVEGDSCSEQ
jgi:hypothetical protein